MRLDISNDMKQVNKMFKTLAKDIAPKAISGAINKTLTSIRAAAAREINSKINIKIGVIKKSIIISKANAKRLNGYYIVIPANNGKGTNLIEFISSAKRTTKAFRKEQGVIAKAWKKNKLYRGTFIARGRSSGKLLVFKKDSSKKSGVKALPAASIPANYFKKSLLNKLDKKGRIVFTKVLQQQIDFRLSKLK